MTRITNTYYQTGYEQGKRDEHQKIELAISRIKERANHYNDYVNTDIAEGLWMAANILSEVK